MHIDRALLHASWRSWLANDVTPRGPQWLQLVWTLLFCMAVALGFTVLGFAGARGGAWRSPGAWLHWYGINLVVSLVIGFLIHGLFAAGTALLGRKRLEAMKGWQRGVYYSAIPIGGVLVGWPLGVMLVREQAGFRFADVGLNVVAAMLMMSLVITLIFYQFFSTKARQIHAERRATEARLQLLQAQIEPHFLFNTLANVVSLIDHDAPRAKLLLETFTDYLRASLGELRRERSTVGAELAMADGYLRLLQLRMEERLRYRIEADEALRGRAMPPLLLQPLVENAITHGLEPKVEGGTVTVRVRRDGETLVIEVEDDGLGLDAARRPAAGGRPGGHGLALANIRERLASRYGEAAGLSLVALPVGTRATLRLPDDDAAGPTG